ncbi:MAG: AAA family ATPase [Candidatus Paceibacterota bacterium]|jgi:ATP-dependent Clp protease ATP-binding subunit ClpC
MMFRDEIKSLPVYNLVLAENTAPTKWRHRAFKVCLWLLAIFAVLLVLDLFFDVTSKINTEFFGLLLVFVSLVIYFLSAEFFFQSHLNEETIGAFDGAMVVLNTKDDLCNSLFTLNFGKEMSRRLGISQKDLSDFLSKKEKIVPGSLAELLGEKEFNTKNVILAISAIDKQFSEFLLSKRITQNDLFGTVDWLLLEDKIEMYHKSFWSKKYLSGVKVLASGWSYGGTYTLDKYARDLASLANLSNWAPSLPSVFSKVGAVESVMSKSSQANLVLVGEPSVSINYVLKSFVERVSRGEAVGSLKRKRVLSLDHNGLISRTKNKVAFETEFIKILEEAVSSGNVILVIENLPAFVESAKSLGSSVPSLMEPYFAKSVNIFAIASEEDFHRLTDSNATLSRGFDKINVGSLAPEEVMQAAETEVIKFENKLGRKYVFNYSALTSAVSGADRYLSYGVMPDKAIDLIDKIFVAKSGQEEISSSDVLNFIKVETNIPLGDLAEGEKEKLSKLEEFLHKRVVGQEAAISSVSNAMRRGRLGIQSPNRPMGSFLFLGPTGVGKTETAKALAETFFGDEALMMRLDMTEYQDSDSVKRLIGSYEENKPGILASMLRDHPYGVLLLDEFEKTDKNVLNLFLQIFDEGIFSDMNGKKVNARNIIFVATSNAASAAIFDLAARGQSVVAAKDTLIRQMIDSNIFKPELLNRFDDVVVFEPLSETELKQIAKLMLIKLASRLKNKGLNLVVDDYLVNFVAKEGFSPVFGARPMNRAIQEKVENAVAKKMISGEFSPGSTIQFKEGEL